MESREREKSTDPVINIAHSFFLNCKLLPNKRDLLSLVWFILGTYIVSRIRETREFSAGNSSAFIKIKRNSLITMLNCLLSQHNL